MDTALKNQMLDMLLGNITEEAKKYANDEIQKIKKEVQDDLEKMQGDAKKLKEELDKVLENCPSVVNLGTVKNPKKEITHNKFDTIIKILSSAKRKEKNIMMVGGAGGGKTHLAKQIAEALKLNFYPMSVGLQTTKSDLLGFINATGQYMPSCIRTAYENGGLLLLDEFDSAHSGVVTILNSLLANGHCSFPDKIVNKHKDFVCLVACNTYGSGANLDYVGRNRLDGATLDRFIIVDVDYDKRLERRLTKNKDWHRIVTEIRKNAEKNGIKMIISPRACMDGADLLDSDFDVKEVIDMVIMKGCSEDIRTKLLKGVSLTIEKEIDWESNKDKNEEKSPEPKYDIDIEVEDGKVIINKIDPRYENATLKVFPNESSKNVIMFSKYFAETGVNDYIDNEIHIVSNEKEKKITLNDYKQADFELVISCIYGQTDGGKTLYSAISGEAKMRIKTSNKEYVFNIKQNIEA